MRDIDIVDTIYRDANASQWGEKMTTAMMYKIAPMMNRAGFRAMDATAISHFEFAVLSLELGFGNYIKAFSNFYLRTCMNSKAGI